MVYKYLFVDRRLVEFLCLGPLHSLKGNYDLQAENDENWNVYTCTGQVTFFKATNKSFNSWKYLHQNQSKRQGVLTQLFPG